MKIFEWWPRVQPETRDWLTEHNGEPLPPHVSADILAVTGGTTDSEWWAWSYGYGGLNDIRVTYHTTDTPDMSIWDLYRNWPNAWWYALRT